MSAPESAVDGRVKRAESRSGGFTLVELLVVITIIGMLMALLLPAVMQARAAGRRTICKNNLRNVGLAMLGETELKRRFPASGNFAVSGAQFYHSWVVNLLAGLERSDIAAKWDYNLPHNQGINRDLARITIAVLVCPDDPSVVPGEGNLSYVVNGGIGWTTGWPTLDCPVSWHATGGSTEAPIDLNGNGIACLADWQQDGNPSDKRLFYQLGLFFGENWPPRVRQGTFRHHSLDTIFDGTSNTIMLSENIRAGYDPRSQTNWAYPRPLHTVFLVSSYICEGRQCSAGKVDYRRANARSENPYRMEAINGDFNQAEGEAPWPSSGHVGGVHVMFADGRIHFLQEEVDGAVYAALASPQGTLVRGPLAQPIVSDGSY